MTFDIEVEVIDGFPEPEKAANKITSIAYINDKIKEEYNRVFSKIEVPKKPSIIT